MFSLEFWLIVSVAAVGVCGLKIFQGASGSPAEPVDSAPAISGNNQPEDTDRSGWDNQQPKESREPVSEDDADGDRTDGAEWLVIASASDRETAYEMLAHLNERGIDAGIREGNTGSPYLEGRSFGQGIPVQVKKRNVGDALDRLRHSEFRETLLVEPDSD